MKLLFFADQTKGCYFKELFRSLGEVVSRSSVFPTGLRYVDGDERKASLGEFDLIVIHVALPFRGDSSSFAEIGELPFHALARRLKESGCEIPIVILAYAQSMEEAADLETPIINLSHFTSNERFLDAIRLVAAGRIKGHQVLTGI